MTASHSLVTSSLSSALLVDLLSNLPHGVAAFEAVRDADKAILDYRTIYYNPAALTIMGYTAEQMETQLMFQRAPYSRQETELLRQVVEERRPTQLPYFVPGLNRWFEFHLQPLNDGYFVTFQDIDDRKRLEQQLETQNKELQRSIEYATQQQALLSSVLNASSDSIIVERAVRNVQDDVIDFQAVIINPAALKLGGYTPEQALSQRISELNPGFEASGLLAAYSSVLQTGQPLETSFYDDSRQVYLELGVTPMDADHLVVVFRDITKARTNAQAIGRQNELLDGVMRTSENAIVVLDPVFDGSHNLTDFRVVLVNDASLRVSERSRDQVIGATLTQLYPATKQHGLWDRYVEVYETGKTFRDDHYYPGTDKWHNVTINKLGDGLVATFNDITTAKQATRQTEEQAQLFDDVLKSITNGLSVLEAVRDKTGAIVDVQYVRVSQAVAHDTGLPEAQLIGRSMLSLFPGVQQTAYWPAFLAAFSTGELQRFESHYHHDGFDNYTDNWITKLNENRIISVYSIINDQKQAEYQALRKTIQLQSVLDSCQMPIVLFEAIRNDAGQIIDFQYLLQNEANARTVGHPLDQTTTKTMLQVLPSLKPTGIFDRYAEVVTTGQPHRFEHNLIDGIVNGWFDISIVKQGDGIVVSATDQTLLRQTLQRAEQLVGDLKQSNQYLQQFAFVASHDLQEPLRKIRSFGDLLLNQYGYSLPEDAQNLIGRMQASAERMSVFIRDLLAFSQLSTQSPPFQSVDLQLLLTEIQADLSMAIAEKQAQVSIGSPTQPLPVINGSLLQLRQLFQNLMSNAVKFSRPDRVPQVSVLGRPVLPENVPATVPNRFTQSWVAVDITDNGIGFEEKYEEQIFQLFERLHGRSAYAGTGIGLAICRKVAENHGGTLLARSQPGQGATFTVYLPLLKSERVEE